MASSFVMSSSDHFLASSFWVLGFFMKPLAMFMMSCKSGLDGLKLKFSLALFFSTAKMSDLVISVLLRLATSS